MLLHHLSRQVLEMFEVRFQIPDSVSFLLLLIVYADSNHFNSFQVLQELIPLTKGGARARAGNPAAVSNATKAASVTALEVSCNMLFGMLFTRISLTC